MWHPVQTAALYMALSLLRIKHQLLHCCCRVHALEAYAVSDREPALPFRVIRTPEAESLPAALAPASSSPQGSTQQPPGSSPAQALSLDASRTVAPTPSTSQLQPKEIAEANATGAIESQHLVETSMTAEPSGAPDGHAAKAASALGNIESTPIANGSDEEGDMPRNASAPWPTSSEVPVKTFVPEIGSRDTSHATPVLPITTHGDALVESSGLAPDVRKVPPQSAHEDATSTMAAQQWPDRSSQPLTDDARREIQPVLAAASEEQGTSRTSPLRRSDLSTSNQSQADQAVEEQVPSVTTQAKSWKSWWTRGQSAVQPSTETESSAMGNGTQHKGPVADESVQLLPSTESGAGIPSSFDGRPAWTHLLPNPEGGGFASHLFMDISIHTQQCHAQQQLN